MTFAEKLKKVCKKCKPNTIRTYIQNVKRLYALLDTDKDIPVTGTWLKSDKLKKAFKKLPLNIRRPLSMAGMKANSSYESKDKYWYDVMTDTQHEYMKQRGKNEKSDREKDKMLGGGIKDLKKAAVDYKRRLKHDLKKDPNVKTLYKYGLWLALRMFTEIPFRNDFANLKVKPSESGNFIQTPKKGNFILILRSYKNSDKLGPRKVNTSRSLSMALRKFLRYRDGLVKHGFLLSTKSGDRLTKSAFGKAIHKLTLDLTSKSFGSQIIRIMHASDSQEIIDKSNKLTNSMLHSASQTKQYVRKD